MDGNCNYGFRQLALHNLYRKRRTHLNESSTLSFAPPVHVFSQEYHKKHHISVDDMVFLKLQQSFSYIFSSHDLFMESCI